MSDNSAHLDHYLRTLQVALAEYCGHLSADELAMKPVAAVAAGVAVDDLATPSGCSFLRHNFPKILHYDLEE